VGIAVSNATDVAKAAASAVLLKEGLGPVIDFVKVGRMSRVKIETWVVNMFAKLLITKGIILIYFFIAQVMAIGASHMVILIFLIDFVTISIATDNTVPAKNPDPWRLGRVIAIGAVFGLLCVGEGLGLIYIGLGYFGPQVSAPSNLFAASYGIDPLGLQTFGFCILFYFTIGALFSAREKRFLWSSSPSWPLMLACGIDSIVVFFIAVFGITPFGISPLWYGWVFASIAAAVVVTIVNDLIKRVFIIFLEWLDARNEKKLTK